MASLLETRKKIRSIAQTKKITKAMQLVSASKMKVFQKRAVSSRQYAWDLLSELEQYVHREALSSYMEHRKIGKHLFILYSSDKGLCGPLNTKLLKALFASKAWQETVPKDRLIFTFGKKAHDFCVYNKIPVEKNFKGIKERMTLIDALEFLNPILEYWNTGKVKQISMIAPHYKSTLVFYPVVKTYLPFSFSMLEEQLHVEGKRPLLQPLKPHLTKEEEEDLMIYEPTKELVLQRLLEQIIHLLFMQAFLELKASEYSSRMMAMQNATDNAQEIIENLTLQYNKARQSKITQELSEMAGTMTAMES